MHTSATSSAHANSMISFKNSGAFTMLSMQSGDSYDMNDSYIHGSEIKINNEIPTTTLLSVETSQLQMQSQNDESNLFQTILKKGSDHICSLIIDNINDKDYSKWYILNTLKLYKSLNHISIHTAIHNIILESWLNNKLQLLNIKYLDLNNIQILNDKLKQIIEYCNNLMVFDCYITANDDIGQTTANNNNKYLTIKFPQNIQFIRLQFISDTFKIDLSQCKNICALYINDTLNDLQNPQLLNTVESGNAENDNNINNNNNINNTVIIDNIIWPINGYSIECLLLGWYEMTY